MDWSIRIIVLAVWCIVDVAAVVRIPLKSGIYLECGETELDITTVIVVEQNLLHSPLLKYDGIRLVCKDETYFAFPKDNSSELIAQLRYTSEGNNTVCLFNKTEGTGNESATKYGARIEFHTGEVISDQLTFHCVEPKSAVMEPILSAPVTITEGLTVDCAQQTNGSSTVAVSTILMNNYQTIDIECKDGSLFIPEKTTSGNYTLQVLYHGDSAASCVFKNSTPNLYTIDVFLFENFVKFDNFTVPCPTFDTDLANLSSTSVSPSPSPIPELPPVIPLEQANRSTTIENLSSSTAPSFSHEPSSVSPASVTSDTEDYILEVEPRCPVDMTGYSSIVIITDLMALTAMVLCRYDETYPFWTQDGVHYEAHVFFSQQSFKSCVFNKRVDAEIYNVHVVVSWGEPGSLIHTVEKRFQVTCTYDDKLRLVSSTRHVYKGMVAPKEIQLHMGFLSKTFASLYLADVLGRAMETSRIYLGRTVQLVAVASGNDSEHGLKPVACDAIGVRTGNRYAILRGGCGDGIVFRKNAGFMTDGLTARSPFFSAFHMSDDINIKFECNVTLCPFSCDSNSCTTERKKRSPSDDAKHQNRSMNYLVAIETDIVNIGHPNRTDRSVSDEWVNVQDFHKFLEIVYGIRAIFTVVLAVCIAVFVVSKAAWIRLFKHNPVDHAHKIS